MRSFKPKPTLSGRHSLYLGIADSLRRSLARGQLHAGELLPSTRQLAQEFGVHRHTLQLSLELLVSEGLLESLPRRGFRVLEAARALPQPAPGKTLPWRGFRLVRRADELSAPAPTAVPYPLHSASPDPALVPHAELKAAFAHTLRRRHDALFELADELGHAPFRQLLSDHLRQQRGLVGLSGPSPAAANQTGLSGPSPAAANQTGLSWRSPAAANEKGRRELMVTHGSQQAIALVAQALLGTGDVVAVEEPGYQPAWQAFRATGARVVGVPVDAHGLDLSAFERLLKRRRVRLLYVTPAHHFPTTVALSPARRSALLALTAHHGVPILEDDYDQEYQYRGLPLPPLAATRAAEHVIYVASVSKLIASGFRLGCVVAAPTLIANLAALTRSSVRAHEPIAQAALAAWMADGGLDRHLRRARREYAARRDALLAALAPAIESGDLTLSVPDGGLGLWARFPGRDSYELALRARARGLLLLPEQLLRLDQRACDGARLAFSRCAPERLGKAGELLIEIVRTTPRVHSLAGGGGAKLPSTSTERAPAGSTRSNAP